MMVLNEQCPGTNDRAWKPIKRQGWWKTITLAALMFQSIAKRIKDGIHKERQVDHGTLLTLSLCMARPLHCTVLLPEDPQAQKCSFN